MAIVLILDEKDVAGLLSMSEALAAVKAAFAAQAAGEISMPLRTIAAGDRGVLGAMPGALAGKTAALGAKLVTLFPSNAELGLHTHNALIALFDPRTGRPAAVMDGRYITEIRTAATSALATSLLARSDARTLAILGTGVQARAHIDALALVMQVDELRIWGRSPENAAALAAFAKGRGLRSQVSQSVATACRGADVVCTVTLAREPILTRADIDAGTHLNAVGFGGPNSREVSGELLAQVKIFIDSADGAARESGNLLLARKDGHLSADQNLTLLSDVLAGRAPGRQSPDEITLFDSLGIAIEDLACARLVFERALAQRVGTSVDF